MSDLATACAKVKSRARFVRVERKGGCWRGMEEGDDMSNKPWIVRTELVGEGRHVIEPDCFEPDERLPNAARALARNQARIRELEGRIADQDKTNAALCEDLRAMVESRNEHRSVAIASSQRMREAQDLAKTMHTWRGEPALEACGRMENELKVVTEERDAANRAYDLSESTLRASYDHRSELESSLKIMTEDRDEYRRLLVDERAIPKSGKACHCNARIADVVNTLVDATEDEQAMAQTYVAKLMGEGRTEHGKLNLAEDDRDLVGEACDELDDVMSYVMMCRRRLEGRKGL